ncbi:MAG: twin transmembrane helix small protein [Proteobacteria bacterium]|nr:twin transmembrane helix small protein [Pseudomonadota bacterium]
MELLTVVIILALAAVSITLATGIISMAHGGEFDQKHSTELMFARAGLQAITVVILILAFVVD